MYRRISKASRRRGNPSTSSTSSSSSSSSDSSSYENNSSEDLCEKKFKITAANVSEIKIVSSTHKAQLTLKKSTSSSNSEELAASFESLITMFLNNNVRELRTFLKVKEKKQSLKNYFDVMLKILSRVTTCVNSLLFMDQFK